MQTMHDKMIWMNDQIQFLFRENIVEYDMVAASLSVSERFHLLDDTLIQQMKLMPKEQRTRKVGMLQRDNKEFSEKLLKGIREMRRKFLDVNGLTEKNILSLHSDAVLFSSKNQIISDIEGVQFVQKGNWSSYIRYDNIEMFYADDYITFKNVPKEMLYQHTMGMTKHLTKICNCLENYDEDVLSYLSKFQSLYLKDKLPEAYYVPFGKLGDYKVTNLKLLAYIANMVMMDMKGW